MTSQGVARRRRVVPAREPAAVLPVARLMVDVIPAHLDRPFDYLVSAELDELVRPGARVRVRFAGRLVDAYVLERCASSDHPTALAFVERAVGTEPVLTTDVSRLIRAVADRYGGTFVDVARLAVPPRHAATERAARPAAAAPIDAPGGSPAWDRYRAGSAFLAALSSGRSARAAWSAAPAEDWPRRFAEAGAAALAAGRGSVFVVPDARDAARLDAALAEILGAGRHVVLAADLGPGERYKRWLAVRRGDVAVVVGPRAVAYAPVADPGLLAIWDDGDDLHREPRSPYPDARDVLAIRSGQSGAALLIGAFGRTCEAQQLVDSGWAHEIVAERAVIRSAMPRIVAAGDDHELERDPAARQARLPSIAWRAARDGLAEGPVLVQVPRGGYVPSLACVTDRTPARCAVCSGPLAATSGSAIPACRWCGASAGDWTCPRCGGRRLRAAVVGAGRTAEELGRAFPGVPVRTSGGDRVLDTVGDEPALVIATPGAEPVAAGGYRAALLMDGWAMLARPDLRAGEEALRRWLNAAALVRPHGVIVVGADASVPAVQALIRWDPSGAAARELAERAELGFPPAVRIASLSGAAAAVNEAIQALLEAAVTASDLVPDVIGPVPERGGGSDDVRALVRVRREQGARLAAALHTVAAARSARKVVDQVRIVLDPVELI